MGNYITLTGKADRIDPVFRTLQVGDIVVPLSLIHISNPGVRVGAKNLKRPFRRAFRGA